MLGSIGDSTLGSFPLVRGVGMPFAELLFLGYLSTVCAILPMTLGEGIRFAASAHSILLFLILLSFDSS